MTLETLGLTQFLERADDDAIERLVSKLPREEVVAKLHFVSKLRRALYQFEKFAQSRVDLDGILAVGEVWAAPDGSEHQWVGDRHRECPDPEGLRAALKDTPMGAVAALAYKAAFRTETKVSLTELDKISRFAPETEDTIRDFLKWKEGPRKLRAMAEEGK